MDATSPGSPLGGPRQRLRLRVAPTGIRAPSGSAPRATSHTGIPERPQDRDVMDPERGRDLRQRRPLGVETRGLGAIEPTMLGAMLGATYWHEVLRMVVALPVVPVVDVGRIGHHPIHHAMLPDLDQPPRSQAPPETHVPIPVRVAPRLALRHMFTGTKRPDGGHAGTPSGGQALASMWPSQTTGGGTRSTVPGGPRR